MQISQKFRVKIKHWFIDQWELEDEAPIASVTELRSDFTLNPYKLKHANKFPEQHSGSNNLQAIHIA